MMPSIFLSQTKCSYETGTVKISVSEEQKFEHTNLFISYTHKLENVTEEIRIYNEKYSQWSFENSDHLTIKLCNSSSEQKPLRVEVFFNKYDSKFERPLLFVVYFGDGTNDTRRYYRYSQFSNLISEKKTVEISELTEYKADEKNKQLLELLLEENDSRDDMLTYQIEIQKVGEYNKSKIIVYGKENVNGPNGNSYGFYKYTHKPTNSNNDKRSCVIYNKNTLSSWNEQGYGKYTEIENLQNNKYTSLTVYRSNKLDVPLMIETVKKNYHNNEEHSYYIQSQYKYLPYWKRLYEKNYQELLGEVEKKDELIHSKLVENNNERLLRLLEKIEFFLLNSVVILLDKIKSYGETYVEGLIKTDDPKIVISTKITDAQPDPINVVRTSCPKLEEHGYSCFLHSFRIKESYKLGELRLLLPSENSNKYTELKLYDNPNTSVPAVLYYEKGKVDIRVYFYTGSTTSGNSGDPRPLLLLYNNKFYRPVDRFSYSTTWVCMLSIDQFPPDKYDDTLLHTLSEVVGFLNTVNLQKHHENPAEKEPNKHGEFLENTMYSVQKFNGQDIDIRITYENKNCYRVYTHTPSITKGYRLGIIKYGESDTGIDYKLYKVLQSVSSYYSVYDFNHEFPILVTLTFSSIDKEYYKLTTKDQSGLSWERIEDKEIDPNNIEKSLYKIRNQLGVSFYSKKIEETLFDPKNCKEYSNSPVVAGFLVGLSLLGVGVGIAYYKFPQLFQPFYKRFY